MKKSHLNYKHHLKNKTKHHFYPFYVIWLKIPILFESKHLLIMFGNYGFS